METLPPDIVTLRREAISDLWNSDKQDSEMQIPLWLISMVYKCLEKSPAKRFKNGSELQEFIHVGSLAEERKKAIPVAVVQPQIMSIDELTWRNEINKLQNQLMDKEALLSELQYQVEAKDKELYNAKFYKPTGISKLAFFVVVLIALGLAGFTGYTRFYNPVKVNQAEILVPEEKKLTIVADSPIASKNKPVKKPKIRLTKNINAPVTDEYNKFASKKTVPGADSTSRKSHHLHAAKEYEIINTAYFYTLPDKASRSNLYLTAGSVMLKTMDETNDFIYVVVPGGEGKGTKGWLLKKDFVPANDY